ncbi:hypothetical protein L1887_27949 [Cichorium endivia]|nr:hypothetical protein L1887_27949 [Cichorium endivia]
MSAFELGESSGASIVGSALPVYGDSGDCIYVCSHCKAEFWWAERLIRGSTRANPIYTQCCKQGDVVLPIPLIPPSFILELLQSRHYMDNIRAYNSIFSMTSFGAKIDETVNRGRGPYTFKVCGQICHRIGSFCPEGSDIPRFLQLYVYDVENEISNRLQVLGDGAESLNSDVVAGLSTVLNGVNEYVRMFKTSVNIASQNNLRNYAIRLYNNVPDVRYNLPYGGTLGGIVTADDPNASKYDVIVHSRGGCPTRISKLHFSYMPLQYPLLFPYGEKGWSNRFKLRSAGAVTSKSITLNMYYSYLIHSRSGMYTLILQCGRLFQQFLVDAYLSVEENRLDYIRNNQNNLRSEHVTGIYDAISKGDLDGNVIGKRFLLPSSFVGGPRYMYKHYQDAIAICRVHGNPQYFVTFTCNVGWPEIVRYMADHDIRYSQDRPDIIARVFQIKVMEFIEFLKNDKPFGDISAYLYTIEFQKRGLPHCHTLVWVSPSSHIKGPADVDKYISAELPDSITDPLLYNTITTCMIHGPCGLLNPQSICMRDGKCSKSYPKDFNDQTFFDKQGYVHYKRNNLVFHTLNNGVRVDNGFVVPYNRRLSSRFNAHINVEYCGWNMLIKYLFKYIAKGVERVSFMIHRSDSTSASTSAAAPVQVDEIKNFVDGRFICPHEAAWRLLNFTIHERVPSVQVLAVHLENMQNGTFRDDDDLQAVVRNPNFGKTTLTGWLVNNRRDATARSLKYDEYPREFRWDLTCREWLRRTSSRKPAVSRLAYVHPTCGELYYLRMLLCHQKGCCTFSDIKKVNEIVYPSYRLACEALGLIGDDKEWQFALDDASSWASSVQLRALFCHLLLFCDVSNPLKMWEYAQSKMTDDIRHAFSSTSHCRGNVVSDDIVQQQLLLELEKYLNASTPSKSLSDFQLPIPSSSTYAVLGNRLLLEETNYDKSLLQHQHEQMVCKLNYDQLAVYNRICTDVTDGKQSLIFVYGHGGTGKTFLWSVVLAYFRSSGKIALAVAASGIAALLLPSGRTAHSRFNIPIDISDISVCNIKKKSHLAELLKLTSVIIWDEATMTDRVCFETVSRSFQDILDKPGVPFGGISVLLGGDFRQTLPVKKKASDPQIMASTLPNSYLWQLFSVYKLSSNMRLSSNDNSTIETQRCLHFANWLLDIGNGEIGEPDSQKSANATVVDIPEHMLVSESENAIQSLIDFVYGSAVLLNPMPATLCNRAIICPKNETTHQINQMVLDKNQSRSRVYRSTDTVTPRTDKSADLDLLYPEEYLNQLSFPGLPLHELFLKENTPVLLLRNMDPANGLCNGTRLIVSQLLPYVIEASIMTGTCVGKRVYVPRFKLIHKDEELPFIFIRKQFPLKVCYAMTINKSQGQSLEKIGIYLPEAVFTHGQLYVALSRATSPDSIKILIEDSDGHLSNKTTNIVFKQLLKMIENVEVNRHARNR